jgi:hypothetical protein
VRGCVNLTLSWVRGGVHDAPSGSSMLLLGLGLGLGLGVEACWFALD